MPLRIHSSAEPRLPAPDSRLNQERTAVGFQDTLGKIRLKQNQELSDFLKRLEVLGHQLAETLSLKDFTEFRDTVKSFLRSTLGQSRQMLRESFWDAHGRPKVLVRMQQINQALDELAHQFMTNNAKPLGVLAKVGEIRGLVIDLFA